MTIADLRNNIGGVLDDCIQIISDGYKSLLTRNQYEEFSTLVYYDLRYNYHQKSAPSLHDLLHVGDLTAIQRKAQERNVVWDTTRESQNLLADSEGYFRVIMAEVKRRLQKQFPEIQKIPNPVDPRDWDWVYTNDFVGYPWELITRIKLRDTIIDIDENDEKPVLTSIECGPMVKEIKEKSFYKCPKLRYVRFNEGLKEIGDYAFALCPNLTEIVFVDHDVTRSLKSSLERIGKSAFSGSPVLAFCPNNTFVFPESIKSVGIYAFNRCGATKKTTIIFPHPEEFYGGNVSEHCFKDVPPLGDDPKIVYKKNNSSTPNVSTESLNTHEGKSLKEYVDSQIPNWLRSHFKDIRDELVLRELDFSHIVFVPHQYSSNTDDINVYQDPITNKVIVPDDISDPYVQRGNFGFIDVEKSPNKFFQRTPRYVTKLGGNTGELLELVKLYMTDKGSSVPSIILNYKFKSKDNEACANVLKQSLYDRLKLDQFCLKAMEIFSWLVSLIGRDMGELDFPLPNI